MSTFAAIDIGSNSVRLQIANAVHNGAGLPDLKTVKDYRVVTRLGQGVYRKRGAIAQEAFIKTCLVLDEMRKLCDEARIDDLRVAGTSAVRDAENHSDFVNRATEILGVPVEVITGDEEGDLVHLGVHTRWRQDPSEHTLIVDLGGGSVQLIYGHSGAVVEKISRPLGAVRLREKYLKHDPPRKRELRAMDTDIDAKLSEVVRKFAGRKFHRMIATSATAAAVVCAVNSIPRAERDRANYHSASHVHVKYLYRKLSSLSLEDRRRTKGVGSRRAEVVVAGVAVLRRVLQIFNWPAFNYSSAGLRDGMIADLAMRKHISREQLFHVFMSHNSRDKPEIGTIASRLKDRGIRAWLDVEELQGGDDWKSALARQMRTTRSAAIFIGPHGVGPGQQREIDRLQIEAEERGCPLIPVLLQGASDEPLRSFLSRYHFIDFRRDPNAAFESLVKAINKDRAVEPAGV